MTFDLHAFVIVSTTAVAVVMRQQILYGRHAPLPAVARSHIVPSQAAPTTLAAMFLPIAVSLSLLFDEAHDEQQDRGTYGRHNDRTEYPASGHTKKIEHKLADDRTDNADDNITGDAKATTLDEFASQPAGDRTNNE
jgi:hypothetical protein